MSEISQEQLEEVRRLERSVRHFEEALKHATVYAMQHDRGWELVKDLQNGYFRHRAALEKARARIWEPAASRSRQEAVA